MSVCYRNPNTYLNEEAYSRLMVCATMARTSPGLYLEGLLLEHCKDWSLPADNRAKKSGKVSAADKEVRPVEVAESTPVEIAGPTE